MKKTTSVNGYCEFLSDNITIDVDYQKVNVLGDGRDYAKATGFSCDYYNECPAGDNCPIFKMASENYDW